MKRTLLCFFFLAVSLNYLLAIPVDSLTAKSVAINFYNYNANKRAIKFTVAYIEKSDDGSPVYYIFNVNQDDGFVIVSGDNAAMPVWGYSQTGKYVKDNLPPNFINWMEGYKQQILYAKANSLYPTYEIENTWQTYIISNKKGLGNGEKGSVGPLLTTKWDQTPYYNDLCPYDYRLHARAVTGCVATTMAQIMKYWNYPVTGSGFHSYNHPDFGTLSANFGSTTYNWSGMPDNVSSTNTSVATLMLQCGVSVEMDYGVEGSGAWVITADNSVCSQSAYTRYFGYDPSKIQGLERYRYTDTQWKTFLNNELNNSRPVQYVGTSSAGGHTWVCDGYDANNYYHMNWGWGGDCDGYFNINSLIPTAKMNFNSNHQALIGIQPLSTPSTASLKLISSITVTPNPIAFAQKFSVNVDFYNSGNTTFKGDYAAALFTSSGVFVDYIQTFTDETLESGYHYIGGIDFNTNGLAAPPGDYLLEILYRVAGGDWVLINPGNYNNPISITINNPINSIVLYSNITPSPTTFIQGQSASVNANFANAGTTTFIGYYTAVLYDLSGKFVQAISVLSEADGLPPKYFYASPVTFSTSSITATPGTYILGMLNNVKGSQDWNFMGGSKSYPNPIKVNVVAPTLKPDNYEINNTEQTPYTFPLTFSGNTTKTETTGSNIHLITDEDYYKINLPTGYNYTISARVNDNGTDKAIYTCNVIWSYNSGNGWSNTYNDVMSGNIVISDGGNITFHVSPYFKGNLGTYLLTINITRTKITDINEISPSTSLRETGVKVYPNPANSLLVVSCQLTEEKQQTTGNMFLYDNTGKLYSKFTIKSSENMSIDVSDFPNGVYFLEAIFNDKSYIKKFIVCRQ